jgi:hypothetical protein
MIEVRYVFRVNTQPPENLRYQSGEILGALGAAVDGVLNAIGDRHGVQRLALVFVPDKKEFDAKYKAKLPKLPAFLEAWLLSQQKFTQTGAEHSFLGRLYELWNADKHKFPTLVGTGIAGYRWSAAPGFEYLEVHKYKCGTKSAWLSEGDEVGVATLKPAFVNAFAPHFVLHLGLLNYAIDAADFFAAVIKHISDDCLPQLTQALV